MDNHTEPSSAASDILAHARTRETANTPQPTRTPWRQHKNWIREAIQTGANPVTVAQQHGIERTTAWRVSRSPRGRKYIASLKRMQADHALQARITLGLSDLDAG